MSMESTEWLDVLMNLHDSIKPEMRSRFADEAEYEDARVELAGRMIEDIMNVPEMTDAQAIFEGMQKQALQMAKAAAGDEARAAEVEKGMQGVQKVQRQEFARRLAANQRTETRSAVKIDGKTFTNLGDVNEYITYQREEFRRKLKQQEQQKTNVKAFIAAVKKYTDLQELDAAVLRAFIDRIEVSHVDKKSRTREITIVYNFIGAFDFTRAIENARNTSKKEQRTA